MNNALTQISDIKLELNEIKRVKSILYLSPESKSIFIYGQEISMNQTSKKKTRNFFFVTSYVL